MFFGCVKKRIVVSLFSFLLFCCLYAFRAETQVRVPGCPCSNITLCQPIQGQRAKEVFGFRNRGSNDSRFEGYDWNVVTTVAWNPSPQLMCVAHAHGARVVSRSTSASPHLHIMAHHCHHVFLCTGNCPITCRIGSLRRV